MAFKYWTRKDKDNRETLDAFLSGRYNFVGFGITKIVEDRVKNAVGSDNIKLQVIILFDGVVPDDYVPK